MTQPPDGQPPGGQPPESQPATGVPTCYRHPDRETWIRCQRCERSICPDCMRDAAVGFQCPDCVKEGAKQTRQGKSLYGGGVSRDPRLTSFVLIGVNAIVWLAITATGGNSSRLADLMSFMPLGRCNSPAEGMYFPGIGSAAACDNVGTWIPGIVDGAWWKLLSGVFTHVEIWHIAMNMLALFILGPVVEAAFGRARFLAVYLLGGLGGSVCALWLSDPTSSGVGASGALFGLIGTLGVMALKGHVNTAWVKQLLFVGVGFTIVGWQHISWQGHLGGLLAGAAAAAIVAYAPRTPSRALVQWAGLGLLTLLLLLLTAVRVAALA